MASRLEAINVHRPRIMQGRLVETEEMSRYLAGRVGLHESQIRFVMLELREGVLFYNRSGRSVRLEGIGIFTPSIDLAGAVSVSHRGDRYLAAMLNLPGAFEGDIVNRQNIGKSTDELVQMWNEEHPDDLVTD